MSRTGEGLPAIQRHCPLNRAGPWHSPPASPLGLSASHPPHPIPRPLPPVCERGVSWMAGIDCQGHPAPAWASPPLPCYPSSQSPQLTPLPCPPPGPLHHARCHQRLPLARQFPRTRHLPSAPSPAGQTGASESTQNQAQSSQSLSPLNVCGLPPPRAREEGVSLSPRAGRSHRLGRRAPGARRGAAARAASAVCSGRSSLLQDIRVHGCYQNVPGPLLRPPVLGAPGDPPCPAAGAHQPRHL